MRLEPFVFFLLARSFDHYPSVQEMNTCAIPIGFTEHRGVSVHGYGNL